MKAVTFSEFGGPEVLRITEVDRQVPGPGRIRVKVHAAGLNPWDTKVRTGTMGGSLPARPGLEFAGTVDAIGQDVSGVGLGDPVFGFAIGGGLAEYTLSRQFALLPAGLTMVEAAGLPVAIETAARTLDELGVAAGTKLVVNGASGAVGMAAVQLARTRGAEVVGTAGDANQELVQALGATPVRYGDGLEQRVREIWPGGADRALDTATGALPDLIALTGGDPLNVVTISDFGGAEQTGARTSGSGDRAAYILEEIGPLITAGDFSLPIAGSHQLDDVVDAYRQLESPHAPGKIVVSFD